MVESPQSSEGRHRHRRSVPGFRELPFVLVGGGVGFGLVVVSLHHFKRGSVLMGAALVLGAALRLLLPEERAGLLAVRGRAFDAVTMASLGLLIAVAAAVVPPP